MSLAIATQLSYGVLPFIAPNYSHASNRFEQIVCTVDKATNEAICFKNSGQKSTTKYTGENVNAIIRKTNGSIPPFFILCPLVKLPFIIGMIWP
jgi:hypothetical protein